MPKPLIVLPTAHLTFHCRTSGCMWMMTPSWLYRSLRFLFVYFLCVFLQRTSYKMSGWVKHKLESRLLENISNLRCVDDTTLIAESKEELKSLFMKVKEKSEEDGLKNQCSKTKFMATVTICSDFGGQENKVCYCFTIYLPWSDGTICRVFWMLSFKPTFPSPLSLWWRGSLILHFLP